MTLFVKKADGSLQEFERDKIIKTCLRMGTTYEIADIIAKKVEMNIRNNIETKRILHMVFELLKKYDPVFQLIIDLREALALLKPKPDFEYYIQKLLIELGYEVIPNQIIRGKCVEHEVDAIIKKNNFTNIVEIKHHYNYHTLTGLHVTRNARAVLEDIIEGHETGLNDLKINKAMIVSNTKLSEHGKRYAECRNISYLGWSYPPKNHLQKIIEENQFYPLSYLKGLKSNIQERLISSGIIHLKQLIEIDSTEIRIKTRLPFQTINMIVKKVKKIFERNKQFNNKYFLS